MASLLKMKNCLTWGLRYSLSKCFRCGILKQTKAVSCISNNRCTENDSFPIPTSSICPRVLNFPLCPWEKLDELCLHGRTEGCECVGIAVFPHSLAPIQAYAAILVVMRSQVSGTELCSGCIRLQTPFPASPVKGFQVADLEEAFMGELGELSSSTEGNTEVAELVI